MFRGQRRLKSRVWSWHVPVVVVEADVTVTRTGQSHEHTLTPVVTLLFEGDSKADQSECLHGRRLYAVSVEAWTPACRSPSHAVSPTCTNSGRRHHPAPAVYAFHSTTAHAPALSESTPRLAVGARLKPNLVLLLTYGRPGFFDFNIPCRSLLTGPDVILHVDLTAVTWMKAATAGPRTSLSASSRRSFWTASFARLARRTVAAMFDLFAMLLSYVCRASMRRTSH